MNQVDCSPRKAGFFEQLHQPFADRGRFFRGLEYHRVPFEQARPDHPQGYGEGKIPRRDHAHHAARLPQHIQILGPISEAATEPIGCRAVPNTYSTMCKPLDHFGPGFVSTLPLSRANSIARVDLLLNQIGKPRNNSPRWMRLVRAKDRTPAGRQSPPHPFPPPSPPAEIGRSTQNAGPDSDLRATRHRPATLRR